MNKLILALIGVFAVLAQQGAAKKDIVIKWKVGGAGPNNNAYSSEDNPVVLCPGDRFIVQWSGQVNHNVWNNRYRTLPGICDQATGTKLTETTKKGQFIIDANERLRRPETAAQPYFRVGYFCNVGMHCETGGMRFVIEFRRKCA